MVRSSKLESHDGGSGALSSHEEGPMKRTLQVVLEIGSKWEKLGLLGAFLLLIHGYDFIPAKVFSLTQSLNPFLLHQTSR